MNLSNHTSSTSPLISAICPVLNEEENIEQVLKFFEGSDPAEKELLIIDGGSTDSTLEIISEWTKRLNNVKLLHNPHKYTPFALNIGIDNSKADIIARLDAHTEYSEDYFLKILQTFKEIDADIVGGPMRTLGKTLIQRSIAYAISTPFGIGDSKFHDENFKGFVDSVYLGAWKRELFESIGKFDESQIKNQDDEFHYRAKSRGKKLYLNPEIKSFYYPRSSLSDLFIQFFNYGLYKPLVLKNNRSEAKFRHIIPSLFVLYILSLPFTFTAFIWMIPILIYLGLDLFFSFKNSNGFIVKLGTLIVYPALQISYGAGFLTGIFKKK